MNEKSAEEISLALVDELQVILATALNSIAGKEVEPEVLYFLSGASHVTKLGAGYSDLRKKHLTYASKILIRPVIEMTANILAAIKQPGFLFQKNWCEYEEEKKLLSEFSKVLGKPPKIQQDLAEVERDWEQFRKHWTNTRSHVPMKTKRLPFAEVLQASGLDTWYAQYLVYCKFTHGAMRATFGDLDETTNQMDNLVMVFLTLAILDQLEQLALVEMPDLAPLRESANALKVPGKQ